jgi:sugar phosphate isomerase/epimerase
MATGTSMNRRRFLHDGFAASAALLGSNFPGATGAKEANDPYRGLKMGVASYSLRKFNLDQAIAMTRELGLKYICLKDVHLPLTSTVAQRHEARRKIEAAGLRLLGGGVIYIKNRPAEIQNIFAYAHDAGMPTIVCSPDHDALDAVEEKAKQYDIRMAIHNHGPGDKRYPSPLDAFRMVKDRDEHMGICLDLGHTVHLGQDPVAAIQKCSSRLYDFHMKDVSEATPKGEGRIVGEGVIDIPGVLKALLQVRFSGHLGLEYELTPDNPLPGMKQSLAYITKVLAGLG